MGILQMMHCDCIGHRGKGSGVGVELRLNSYRESLGSEESEHLGLSAMTRKMAKGISFAGIKVDW